MKNLLDSAKPWSTTIYEINNFLIKDNFSKYSDKTAPYNKCLEFITPTDVMATSDEAPPDKSCINIICEAPPKIIKEVA